MVLQRGLSAFYRKQITVLIAESVFDLVQDGSEIALRV